MNMLYARVGTEQMETMTKLFGGDSGAPIKEMGHQGGEIDFERYWEAVREHCRRFHDTIFQVCLSTKQREFAQIVAFNIIDQY